MKCMVSAVRKNKTDRVVAMSRIRKANTKNSRYKNWVDTVPKERLFERVDMVTERLQRVEEKRRAQKYPQLFVIMPFSPDLEDVYYLGIHDIARELGFSCERVDEMQFVGGILDKTYDSIRNSRIVIAEVSLQNVNVYYELGYAHALDKPTILVTTDVSSAPFDVKGFNHIVYTNIRDLRNKLRSRLSAILGL